MSQHEENLFEIRVAQSEVAIKSAGLLLEANDGRGALNRIYYGCFYLVIAHLSKQNIKTYTHTGVATMFQKHYIKRGRVSLETGKIYMRIFNMRLRGDYKDILEIEFETVKFLFDEAKKLIAELNGLKY